MSERMKLAYIKALEKKLAEAERDRDAWARRVRDLEEKHKKVNSVTRWMYEGEGTA